MTEMITVRIKRFNPDIDKKAYWQDFEIELTPDKTVLSALEEIKAEHDGSLTFRRSCRHAICGSCAMMVNRRNTLVCTKPLGEVVDGKGLFVKKGVVTIEPLPYLPVIKDLVVDRSVFWEQYERVKPWLIAPDDTPDREFRVLPTEVAAIENAETCIMCGACFSSCPIVNNTGYLGPHALLKSFMRVLDPRDTAIEERLDEIANDKGVFRCHKVLNCIDACPKGLNPAKAIAVLAQMALQSGRFEGPREARIRELIESAMEPELEGVLPETPQSRQQSVSNVQLMD